MTGHADLGSYYSRFVPSEEVGCPCSEDLQTRERVLLACTIHDDHCHPLGETDQDRNIPKLLGTRGANIDSCIWKVPSFEGSLCMKERRIQAVIYHNVLPERILVLASIAVSAQQVRAAGCMRGPVLLIRAAT